MNKIINLIARVNLWLFPPTTYETIFKKIDKAYGTNYKELFTKRHYYDVAWTEQEKRWFYNWLRRRLYFEGLEIEEINEMFKNVVSFYGFWVCTPSVYNLERRIKFYLQMLWIFR